MRVGVLASSLSAGGAERQAALWARAAAEAGHDVEVLVLHRLPQEYAMPPSVEVRDVGKRGAMDLLRILRAVRAFSMRVDVLAVFQAYVGMFCAVGRLHAPWVLVTGEDPRRFGDTSRIPGAVLRGTIQRAPLRCAPTRGLADCHRSLGLGNTWEVVPNIVAHEAFAPRESGTPVGALWVGRLVPEKDPALAVEAARRAGVPLTLLGDGPLHETLARGGDGVRLERFTPEPWPLYARHRLLLLTSRYEAFGNVLVEALAAGRPVVAGDCDFGPREVLADAPGSRLVPRNPNALAAALEEVAARPLADEEAAACRATAARYSMEALAPRVLEILETAARR